MLLAFAFVLAVIAGMSDTSIGRALRELLSRSWLPRLTRGRLAIAMLLIVFTTALLAFLKTDGLALAARAAPDAIAWFAAFDVATYLDVVAISALAALVLRLRVVWVFIRSAGSRCAGVVRAIRRRRSNRTHRRPNHSPRGSDDGDERWGEALFA
jgi:hypothetical protein